MGMPVAPRRGVPTTDLFIAHSGWVSAALLLSACVSGSPAGKGLRFDAQSLDIEMRDWEVERPRIAASADESRQALDDSASLEVVPQARLAGELLDSREKGLDIDAVDVPLSSLLFALARDADLELVLQERLDQPVTLRLNNASLEAVLEVLSGQVAFRYQLIDKRLEVSTASAYTDSYAIDYLNLDRQTESRVGLATQVGTINVADGSGSGIANSSETLVTNSADHHFWASLANDLDTLLAGVGSVGTSVGEAEGESGTTRWTINRDLGLLTMHGPLAAHRRLKRYLARLHNSARRQVLIEATVVEVALSDSFQAGIDWQVIAGNLSGINAAQLLTGAPAVTAESASRLPAPSGLVSVVQKNNYGDVRATLSLLEQFGDVRILSRPRIIALNNQSSVLKVVDNRVYFTLNVERRRSDETDEYVTESQIHTVPVGLVMNVTPFIDSDDAVMLNVRPTLSRILGFVNDPNPALALANVKNGVPEIQVREMESMLRVSSGELAIIGGLMQETTRDTRKRIPALGRLPLFGKLFSQKATERTQTELLVVLRPTIMPEAGFSPGQSVASRHLSSVDDASSSLSIAPSQSPSVVR